MKRLLISLFAVVAAGLWAAPATTPALVQIKAASLYAKPSATGKFLGQVPYGTKLSVLSVKDDWGQVKVEGSDLSGWMRTQAYTVKALDQKAGSNAGAVTSTEVSLAGRGFTDGVEKEYRQEHPNLDFLILDLMEQQGVSQDDLDAFLRDGGLKPDGERK